MQMVICAMGSLSPQLFAEIKQRLSVTEMTSQLTLVRICGILRVLFRDSWMSDVVNAMSMAATG